MGGNGGVTLLLRDSSIRNMRGGGRGARMLAWVLEAVLYYLSCFSVKYSFSSEDTLE